MACILLNFIVKVKGIKFWLVNALESNDMTKTQLLEIFVLNEVSDDYENLQYIVEHVQKWSAEYGLTPTRFEIVKALISLVEAKLIFAVFLSPKAPNVTEITDITGKMDDLYYYQTSAGKTLHQQNDEFYIEGILRKETGFERCP